MKRDNTIKLLLGGEQGVTEWNSRRAMGQGIPKLEGIDLSLPAAKRRNMRGVNLHDAYLRGSRLVNVDLIGADLTGAKIHDADLYGANLDNALMSGANLIDSDLCNSSLQGTVLTSAYLQGCNLNGANLKGADLRDANLEQASLVRTCLQDAKIDGCLVYGISAWDVDLKGASQQGLRIIHYANHPRHSDESWPVLTVDDLEVAQFIYVFMYNDKVRRIIDTITSKVVLLLGAFSHERKPLLDAIREELRRRDYCPVMLDFEKPVNRDFTNTIQLLAQLARFVIVDLSDPRCVPHELATIVPTLRTVPIVPVIAETQREYGMFKDFSPYPWVLDVFRYKHSAKLLLELQERIIIPAEKKLVELKRLTKHST